MGAVETGSRPSKSRDGLPAPLSPRGVDLRLEAHRSGEHLLPSALAYGVGGLALTAPALNGTAAWWAPILAGVLVFSGVEYFIHRFLLHGRFPDGAGWRRFLHRRLDHLHYIHHLRPWDGAHMHGGLRDTLPLTVPLAALALIGPRPAPAFLGALLLAYVAEEWVHHALHYCRSNNPIPSCGRSRPWSRPANIEPRKCNQASCRSRCRR